MKKILINKLVLLFLLLPASLFAQDITGLWKGEMYVDSTKKYLPYEISISEVKGKLVGYSLITFEENGKVETGTRDITIQQKDDQVTIEDVSLIESSFGVVPPKKIKKTMVVTLIVKDTLMTMKGTWSTNRIKHYYAATGTVTMHRKNDFKSTDLYKKLDSLKLTDKLVFTAPVKKPVATIAKAAPPKTDTIAIAPIATPVADSPIATITRPVETKKPVVVNTPPPVVPGTLINPDIKQPSNAIAKPVKQKPTPVAVETKPVEIKKPAPVVVKQAPPKPAPVAVVTKPAAIIKPAPPVVKQPVAMAPAIVAKPKEVVVEEKKAAAILPSAAEGAADVNKRSIATTQSVFYQSDSLVLTLYDNGYVDGDTVSVVMNGEVIFSKQGLSTRAVSKTIHIDKNTPDSITLVMYAENLGSIPPNTGLLVVHDGEAVYDVRFSADLSTNAAIILKRKKKE